MNSLVQNIDKRENFLVGTLVFYAMWTFVGGFMGFQGGLMTVIQALHGSIPVIIFLFAVFINYRNNKPSVYSTTVMQSSSSLKIIASLFFMSLIPIISGHGLLTTNILFDAIVAAVFFTLRDDIKVRVLDLFIRLLAVLLLLSAIEWLVYRFTGFSVQLGQVTRYKITYIQTLFNFIPISSEQYWVDISMMGRFQSIANEPGAVGTLCAFMIFATSNSKRYRFEYIVYWVAGILSFSMAFYVMAAMSFVIQIRKTNLKYLLLGSVVVLSLYSYFSDMFNFLIVDRFTSDTHGDNRINEVLQMRLLQSWSDGSLWFGNGIKEFDVIQESGGVAGALVSIYQYGIIGVTAMVLAYSSIYLQTVRKIITRSKLQYYIFFIVFWASFYQRQNITSFFVVLVFFTMPLLFKYKEEELNKYNIA